VMSAATGAGATVASEAEKASTSAPPTIEGAARVVPAAPLTRRWFHLHRASSTRAWRR
jgi:hypothetical protein